VMMGAAVAMSVWILGGQGDTIALLMNVGLGAQVGFVSFFGVESYEQVPIYIS
jgi:hypothetical protein